MQPWKRLALTGMAIVSTLIMKLAMPASLTPALW